MLVKTLLIALVSFIGFLECGVGNSMIQRPIVMARWSVWCWAM